MAVGSAVFNVVFSHHDRRERREERQRAYLRVSYQYEEIDYGGEIEDNALEFHYSGASVIVANDGPGSAYGITLSLSAAGHMYESEHQLWLPDTVGPHVGDLHPYESRTIILNYYALDPPLKYSITWSEGDSPMRLERSREQSGVVSGTADGFLA